MYSLKPNDIHGGDKVRCIRPTAFLKEGEIYTVLLVTDYLAYQNEVQYLNTPGRKIILAEKGSNGSSWHYLWDVERFEKL